MHESECALCLSFTISNTLAVWRVFACAQIHWGGVCVMLCDYTAEPTKVQVGSGAV